MSTLLSLVKGAVVGADRDALILKQHSDQDCNQDSDLYYSHVRDRISSFRGSQQPLKLYHSLARCQYIKAVSSDADLCGQVIVVPDQVM